MFKRHRKPQLSIYDFITPFGGHLNEENRWVVMANAIDWDYVDEVYEKSFTKDKTVGNVAYDSRIAFGALCIQKKLDLTDAETVEMIQENPYLQYFIGYHEYTYDRPFDSSTMVYFRKRFPEDVMNDINEHHFKDRAGGGGSGSSDCDEDDSETESDDPKNSGTLIIDATCAPADIAYPTDLELADKARGWTEDIFDYLYLTQGNYTEDGIKPRTYREVARHRFLNLNKRSKKSQKQVRKELRYQLNCIERNIGYINHYDLSELPGIMMERYSTIRIFLEQQREMLEGNKHYVKDRIVSLAQPWVRPIVRGKAKAKTEFGAKLSISVVNGYIFVDHLSFDAYNEGDYEEFTSAVELYKKRFGCYPERILADKIYRSRKNRKYCTEHGIRMSGPKLGKPKADNSADIATELKEIGERNEVEGKFGTGKRKYGLNLIKAKLEVTARTDICMNLFVENLEHQIREDLRFFSLSLFEILWEFINISTFDNRLIYQG